MGSKDAFTAETDLAMFLTGLSALLKPDELMKSFLYAISQSITEIS